jgi:glutaredoxin 3
MIKLAIVQSREQPNRPCLSFSRVSNVILYTTDACPYCTAAKVLLADAEIEFEEVNLERDPTGRAQLAEQTGLLTFPQIVINQKPLGGYQELAQARRDGALAQLLQSS